MELCCKGGVLFLARAILNLNVAHPHLQSSRVGATLSRLKAKVLSILLSLCEAESISYLDEVASTPRSLDFAKSVALQILELLKNALSRDSKSIFSCSEKRYPTGFLQLNAMRLADIFSDDSNFRSYITVNFTKVLTAVFSLSHGDFLSSWCSSDLPVKEEDATLEYDSFAAAGWVLDNFFSSGILHPKNLDFTLIPSVMAPASYAHQRTSLFVKVIANLHCFVPSICEEQERNLFLHGFVDCLKMDIVKALPGSDGSKATNVCRNLRSLLSQAESLIPNFLNEEDVQLLRPVTTVFLPLRGEPIRFKGSVKFLCWQEGLNQSLSDIIYGGGRNHNPKGDYTPRKLRSQGFALPPLSRRGLKAVHNRVRHRVVI
ncbi:nodulin homeobox isoform X2 [Cucumis melo var. makuwa]|uniref:Nodulin homeobox isoform X2 n=1 Tax=Cucumis melo var. makuwa TaxID=1194695 RepID=A0A5D3DAI7_CUCMM|nr:nodulin homeobox isoform X2 [Cucumis melo var. makuwa]